MNAVTDAKKVAGDSNGRVTRLNRPQVPAPSMEAASWRSAGMFCSPTRKIMNVNPSVAHTSMITSPGSDQKLDANQLGGFRPIFSR